MRGKDRGGRTNGGGGGGTVRIKDLANLIRSSQIP